MTNPEDRNHDIDPELARCAQVNFENLARALPALAKHPYYMIAKAQLDEALGGPTVEESLRPHIRIDPEGKEYISHPWYDSNRLRRDIEKA